MNKPTQPDKKSMEEKIAKIIRKYYHEITPPQEQRNRDLQKELLALFTESLKGMEAMKMEKDEKVYGLDEEYHIVSSSPRNALRKQILEELERNTNGK